MKTSGFPFKSQKENQTFLFIVVFKMLQNGRSLQYINATACDQALVFQYLARHFLHLLQLIVVNGIKNLLAISFRGHKSCFS